MKYTYVKQHDETDCAAACLAMVCLHYKKETSVSKLNSMMGTDLKGTNIIGLSKCAQELGFDSQVVRVDKKGLLNKYTFPAIANISTEEGLIRFVVIFEINEDYVILGDPARDDLINLEFNEFYKDFVGILLTLKPDKNFFTNLKKEKKVFHQYIQLILSNKKQLFLIILTSIVLTIIGVLLSVFNRILLDEILPYKLKNTLVLVAISFSIIAFIKVIVGFVRQWLIICLSLKIDIPFMFNYFEHIYKLPINFFTTGKMGNLFNRLTDVYNMSELYSKTLLNLTMDIIMALFFGMILPSINTSFSLIVFSVALINFFLLFIFRKPYKRIIEEQMEQSSVMNSQIVEGVRAIETIKGNANENSELIRIKQEHLRFIGITIKENMLSNIQGSLSKLVYLIGYILIIYLGILQIINNKFTLGNLMAFIMLSGYFMDPVNRMVNLQLQMLKANGSIERINDILTNEKEQKYYTNFSDGHLETVEGDIEIRNITFRYGNRNKALENISFTIPKGKKVALVGESGSGKTTLAKLLLKYYEPESGEILIDGKNIREYSNESLRRAISYVPQYVELFAKNIFENIRASKMDSTLEEVKEAAIAADAHGFIKKFPMQYYTYLGESGNDLSAGEKQKIGLARAFLKKSEFYILDESTSNLDFDTENIIFDQLYNKLNKKSMLIIAHRLSVIKNCDLIIVLKDGKIIEKGTHTELLSMRGQYYLLWEMQHGKFAVL